ncbi:MAG TPA: potassium channel family protein [Dehalococcoidia bacterium]
MVLVAAAGGTLLILTTLWDAFETIVLPRRVARQVRLTVAFYRLTWRPWSAAACRLAGGRLRETLLSYYGSLSLILLLATWSAALIAGFAGLLWAFGFAPPGGGSTSFGTALYLSGTNFFTLGLGDIQPETRAGRAVTVAEVGIGLAFLALVVSYLPVLYQAFSRREVNVSLLDARAGSPPSAGELLRRYNGDSAGSLERIMRDWEGWAAELLETHLSHPVLAFYRSQHERQSWLAALTTILDASALVLAGAGKVPDQPVRLTFAMARHAAVDLAQVFVTAPAEPEPPRLDRETFRRLYALLAGAGVPLDPDDVVAARLAELRALYEPYVNALANYLLMPLPPWFPPADALDAWQTSAWERGLKPGPGRQDRAGTGR